MSTTLARSVRLVVAALVAACAALGAQRPAAAASTCTAVASGPWFAAATWDCGVVPATVLASKTVVIPAGLTVWVRNANTIVNRGAIQVEGVLELGAPGTLNNRGSLTITGAGTLDNLGGTVTNFAAGTIANDGTVNNTSGATLTVMGGTVANEGALANEANLTVEAGALLTNAVSHLLSNSGPEAVLTILADGELTSDGIFTNTSEGQVINQGQLTTNGLLINNAGARLSSQDPGLVTNTGYITSYSGGLIVNEGIWVNDGGELRSSDLGSTINNLDINGLGRMVNRNGGALVNRSFANFYNADGATFTNEGSGDTLVNEATGTIQNDGTMGNGYLGTITNDGSIVNCLVIDTTLGTFVNNGTLFDDGLIVGVVLGNAPISTNC